MERACKFGISVLINKSGSRTWQIFAVYFVIGSWKFTRQHVMNTIWDRSGVKLKGTMPDRILNFFIRWLNRSTWMRARDNSLLFMTSSFVNAFLPPLNGGISRVAPFSARRSHIVKPRSAWEDKSAAKIYPKNTFSHSFMASVPSDTTISLHITTFISFYSVSQSSCIFWPPTYLWHGLTDQAHILGDESMMN